MSRQIRTLEHVVGQPLFVRQHDGLRLTAIGLVLRDEGAKVIAAADTALEKARGATVKGERVVRFGYYGISVWDRLLAPAVEVFGRRFPHVTLNMCEESSVHLAKHLREGRLDVALLAAGDYERIPGAATEVACRVPARAVLAMNHPLAKRRALALEELRDEPIIGFTQQDAPGKYRAFIAACRDAGFTPKVSYVASIFPEVTTAVKKRMGVAILSAFAENVPHPGVVFIPLKPPGVLLDIYVARALHSPPEAAELAQLLVGRAQRVAATMN